MWHVSPRSGVTTFRTAIHLLLTYFTLLYFTGGITFRVVRLFVRAYVRTCVRAERGHCPTGLPPTLLLVCDIKTDFPWSIVTSLAVVELIAVHLISCSQSLRGYWNIQNITRLSFIIHVCTTFIVIISTSSPYSSPPPHQLIIIITNPACTFAALRSASLAAARSLLAPLPWVPL